MKNVNAKLVRESNAWGPRGSRWYVELHETIHNTIIATTDLAPSRSLAMRDAFALAAAQDWTLTAKESN